MALSTPQLQARSRSPRDWGNYASTLVLPNASGAPLPARQFALEAGDTAFVINEGQRVCFLPGTPGGGDAIWLVTAGSGNADGFYLFDDFISLTGVGNIGWTVGVSGAGSGGFAVSPLVGDNVHPGQVRVSKGTTAAGRGVLSLGVTRHRIPAGVVGGRFIYEALVQVPILATVAEDFFVNIGGSDNVVGAQPTQGLIFRYDFPSLTWDGVIRNAAADVAPQIGPAVVAAQWVKLRIDYDAAVGLRYLIAAPSPGPLVQIGVTVPLATVAPLAAAVGAFAPQLKIQGVAGLLTRDLLIDYASILYSIPNAR